MVSIAKKIKIQHNNSTTYVCTQHAGAQHICAQHTHKAEDQCKGGKPPTKRWTIEEDQGPPALSGRPLTQSGRPPTMRRSKAEGRQRSKGSAGSRHICECIKQTTARDANACECIPSGKPPQIRTHKAERRHRRMHTADIRLVCQMMKIVYGDRYSEKKLLRVFASDRFFIKTRAVRIILMFQSMIKLWNLAIFLNSNSVFFFASDQVLWKQPKSIFSFFYLFLSCFYLFIL